MKDLYRFHPSLVIRTPALPFDSSFDEASLREQAATPAFAEALYLASPDLHEESRKWQLGKDTDPKKQHKLAGSLLRYYARMNSRCTPFALFAGCGVVRWGEASRIVRSQEADRRHTRLDMHYLCALAMQLAGHPSVNGQLRYFPNSSLYQIGEEMRYTEFRHEASGLVHQISSVTASEPLLEVLAASRGGVTRAQLVEALANEDVTPAEALDFVEELIAAQLLVSELEPTVTGPEYMTHLLAVLTRLQAAAPSTELAAVLSVLERVRAGLAALDEAGISHDKAAYERMVEALATLEAPIEKNKLFQTDLICGVGEGTVEKGVQDQLLEALEVLQYLAQPHRNERLEQFRQLFYARYEDQEVPLLEALDNESGISYSSYGSTSYSSLVHDLAFSAQAAPERSISQNDVQHFLYQKLRAADRTGDYTITLTKEELLPFGPLSAGLPPSVSVMFRLGAEPGQVVLESVGGSSAANLLGRFAHAEPRIGQLVRELTAEEQRHNPGVRFAEICHLPVSRIGNILLRPSFRDYEIPYLAQSVLPAAQQLPLQDLFLSVRRGQLTLRSRKTGHTIIPRLSSAHNYTTQALPVYQFLCDLQTQGLQPHLNFSWSSISFYTKFLPRLTYKQVVLQVASWQLDAADFEALLSAADAGEQFRAFRAWWRLPRFFTLADGDNELLVDAENPVSVRSWLDTIRSRRSIRLKEFLFDPGQSPVRDAQGRPYVSQFVAALVRQSACYASPAVLPAAAPRPVQREFTLGSEWFYTKLYCGPKVANRILAEVVKPLTDALLAEGLIDRFFFVRYADPDNHLRVRLHLPDTGRIGEVVRLINEYVEPCVASGYLWKTQTDTYRRELERYGSLTIGQAEELYCADSHAALALIAETALDHDADTRQWLWGIRLIDELLNAFQYPLDRKVRLLEQVKTAFAREFNLDKETKLQVDGKYRQHRAAIQRMLHPDGPDTPESAALLAALSYHRHAPVQQLAQSLLELAALGRLEVDLDQLLSSYMHMLLNRLVSVQPRLHEMVIYDFLYREYHSQQARRAKEAAAISSRPLSSPAAP